MAALSNNTIAESIYETLSMKAVTEQAALYPKVVEFLARKNLLSKAPEILTRLERIINEKEGIVAATVYSAEHLAEKDKKEISRALSKRYSGKTASITEKIDKRLLGGFKIEVNDEVIDLSVKNRMKKLQAHLNKEQ